MQASKARELRKKYGNKPCNHPELDKEYMSGYGTGDYLCTTCGAEFKPSDYKKWKADQSRK